MTDTPGEQFQPVGATGLVLSPHWSGRPALTTLWPALAGPDGADVRAVGGCVRDTILGEDVSDIDIGVPFDPTVTLERLEASGIKAVATGIDHGTVTAVVDGQGFEVTSLRLDVETDGRRAAVAFTGDWREDAQRRDFTINALSMARDGRVFDYFGGLDDLEEKRIRFVGDPDRRIAEDALRLLRFYRFAARFGMAGADPAGRDACKRHAPLIGNLSRERIGQEFLKTIVAAHAVDALRAMAEDDVLQQVATVSWDVDRFARLVALEAAVALEPGVERRLCALLADPALADTLARSLRLSNAQSDHMLAVLQRAPDALEDRDPEADPANDRKNWRAAFYRHGAEVWRDATILGMADDGRPDEDRLRNQIACVTDWIRPQLPVRGADLVARGITGPAVGKGLEFVERWWIANDFQPDRDAALDKLEEAIALVRAMNGGPP